MVAMSLLPWRLIRGQDVVWLLLFTALGTFSSNPTALEISLVLCLGAFQILEGRVKWFALRRGMLVAVLLKLVLCYLLIGWTGGISSSYYVVLLLPVMSAATGLEAFAALGVMLLACLSYLSFLLPVYVDYSRYQLTVEGVSELALRVVFLPVVGLLTYQNAKENRKSVRRYHEASGELETANRNLQIAEAAVRRAERLAALGQLTAGLAHELRNPLGTIRASAEMLARRISADDSVAHELAGFISSEVDRTNSLITRFLEFARPVHLHLEQTDITRVLDAAIGEFEHHQPPLPVSIHRSYLPEMPPVAADAELLQRVFYNLILNAAQASPAGATVTLKARAASDEYISVDVIDRGRGIDERNLEQIFNPFFTTRSEGVGLGLAIVTRIVDEHGGSITVESEAGAGTVFRVFLPAGRNEAQSKPPVPEGRRSATAPGPIRN